MILHRERDLNRKIGRICVNGTKRIPFSLCRDKRTDPVKKGT